jgi:hypothetical protein
MHTSLQNAAIFRGLFVVPAKAGTQVPQDGRPDTWPWMPACAGMTGNGQRCVHALAFKKLYGGDRARGFVPDRRTGLTGTPSHAVCHGGSQTRAKLEAPCGRALRLDANCKDPLPYHFISLYPLTHSAGASDIVHFHTDCLHFPPFAPHWGKMLTTLHGRLDLPDLPPIFREFAMLPLASTSNAQRAPIPWANWYGTVYHGLPKGLYHRGCGDCGYLAFIGRMCPEKRLIGPLKSLTGSGCS